MKKSKLLQIVSILIILTSILSVCNNISSLLNPSKANEQLAEIGLAALPTWFYALSTSCEIVAIAAGVIGIMGKTRNLIMSIGIANLVFAVISSVVSMIIMSDVSGFSGACFISLIFPVLYLLGCARSREFVK